MEHKVNFTREMAIEYHLGGKVGLGLLKKLRNDLDLSLAYTPGVAEVCRLIEGEPEKVYDYTAKGNTVAVVTDGTAVLGLGDVGPLASIPVMEGKAVLFKSFAGVDAWPVPLDNVRTNGRTGETDIEKVIESVVRIAPMYGGINLEDIAAPECFEIEDRLIEMLDIPVFHDDQHGTAVISLAGLKNYLLLSGKSIGDIKVVINGAGAAGIRIGELFRHAGVRDIIMCDSHGVIHSGRNDLNHMKNQFAIDTEARVLADALKGADVFIGVSKPNLVDAAMVQSMAGEPAIFAMSNPVPEILPEEAHKARSDAYIATGRSDYPNQINNVLGFPFIFRGALDVKARDITTNMKIACADALANLAREEVPEYIRAAYGGIDLKFGREYLIPKPFDRRVLVHAASAVAKAAMDDNTARKRIDIEKYRKELEKRIEKVQEPAAV